MPVFFNNQFSDKDELLLGMDDLSIQRGYAVFDFFRTVAAKPLFLEDHLNRFYYSAGAMHLPISKTKEELAIIIHELIKRSDEGENGIRILLTGGYSPDGFLPGTPNLIVTCKKLVTASAEKYKKGISIITYAHQRELPDIKSTNYLMAVWLQPLLKERNADDVLYFRDNCLTEFPRGNIFIVTNEGTLVTPARNILKGITRIHIINLAKGFLKVEEREITKDELMAANEVFYTSTTKKVLPVVSVDGRVIGDGKPGKVTTEIYRQFLLLEQHVLNN